MQHPVLREKTITPRDLISRCKEILHEIHRDGVVYIVRPMSTDSDNGSPTRVDESGEVSAVASRDPSFVLGPVEICGRVLGLIDEEYGWPTPVQAGSIKTVWDIYPGPKCHPFIENESGCLAVGIQLGEYTRIKEKYFGNSSRRNSDDDPE